MYEEEGETFDPGMPPVPPGLYICDPSATPNRIKFPGAEYNDLEGHWDVGIAHYGYGDLGSEDMDTVDSGTQGPFASTIDSGYQVLVGHTQQETNASTPVSLGVPAMPLQPRSPTDATGNMPDCEIMADMASKLTAIMDPAGTVEASPPQGNLQGQTPQPTEVKLGWPQPRYAPSARVYCLACRRSLKYKTTQIQLHVETNMHIGYAGKYALVLRRTGACEAPYSGDLVLGPSPGRLIVQVKSDEPYIWWVAEEKEL